MATFTLHPNDPVIAAYYAQLDQYRYHHATHEMAIRQAFATLLERVAAQVTWTLILERTLDNRARPDGVLLDTLRIARGYWEAKDPDDNLDLEIAKKIERDYPTFNTIFENSERGVLYQYGTMVLDIDLRSPDGIAQLLSQFFSYTGEDIEKFYAAVQEFQERIPLLAQGLITRISQEITDSKQFRTVFTAFHTVCQDAMHPTITQGAVQEMLVQHLLTERLFRTIFDNPEFMQRNAIAVHIEQVITALKSRAFSSRDFLGQLDTVYHTIEENARRIEDFTAKQPFLNVVYERFFHGFSVKQADTHGIIYTPQAIVDFMCASIESILQQEFHLTLASPDVQILDPCVGTGTFMLNLIKRIPKRDLTRKYEQELFCNEVLLLPYYIATLNIEHAYYALMQHYKPFPGICLVDTLDIIEDEQQSFFNAENSERVARQKAAPLMIIIGNPPYNVGQQNENDNNKNRPYPVIDQRIRDTYAKDSKATLKMQLYDAYVRFFRWAIDRLDDRDGVICFVTNNGFLHGIAFDGFRKNLARDFTHIYHFDFAGNARKSGEPRRKEGGNIFNDQVRTGIGITLLLRKRTPHKATQPANIWYHRVGDYWKTEQKTAYLRSFTDMSSIPWQQLLVDDKHNWLTEELHAEFATFVPMGTKIAKTNKRQDVETLFKLFSNGVSTGRDAWVFHFDATALTTNIQRFMKHYNSEVKRYPNKPTDEDIDSFVHDDGSFLKWTDRLKNALQKQKKLLFEATKLRRALYRPYSQQWLYFDNLLVHRRYQQHHIFPTPASEAENVVICVSNIGSNKPFQCIIAHCIVDFHVMGDTQCFPFYTYNEDGSNRRDNITDWAVQQFTAYYGMTITKWDIFQYTYALLHHPVYRERYAENLKRELPRIPMLGTGETFTTLVEIGKQLMHWHLDYETVAEHPALQWVETKTVPWAWQVQKMRLNREKTAVIVNPSLTITGIPASTFAYRLGNRSALEWVIDQYQVKTDSRSGITNDPNRRDAPDYIARLVGKIVTVSVETMALVARLGAEVVVDVDVNREQAT